MWPSRDFVGSKVKLIKNAEAAKHLSDATQGGRSDKGSDAHKRKQPKEEKKATALLPLPDVEVYVTQRAVQNENGIWRVGKKFYLPRPFYPIKTHGPIHVSKEGMCDIGRWPQGSTAMLPDLYRSRLYAPAIIQIRP